MTKTLDELLKEDLLPENLEQVSPFSIAERWLQEATALAWQPNPNAMLISTLTEKEIRKAKDEANVFANDSDLETRLVPDARVVLCKDINVEQGYVVFYTNYQSAKGTQLKHHAVATAVFHWDNLGRQVRISGEVTKTPMLDSENYFNSRHPLSRLGAWASDQSKAVLSRQELLDKVEAEKKRYADAGDNIPRPPHWGGYRLWADKIECWISHPGRIHDRAVWTREITDRVEKTGPEGLHEELHFSTWSATRLQP